MKLLLHVCCAPDVTVALERLPEVERLALFFDNPNIHPPEEFARRWAALQQVSCFASVVCLLGDYDPETWRQRVVGFETQPEGGERCRICITYRLERTAEKAKELRFDTFASVFTTSPHKNAELINTLGDEIAAAAGLTHLRLNFKKQAGFVRSVEISRQLGLYRQNYCGCVFSIKNKDQ
ncbi:MAG: epoxyqueuosine reductase QueH [bacterium]